MLPSAEKTGGLYESPLRCDHDWLPSLLIRRISKLVEMYRLPSASAQGLSSSSFSTSKPRGGSLRSSDGLPSSLLPQTRPFVPAYRPYTSKPDPPPSPEVIGLPSDEWAEIPDPKA